MNECTGPVPVGLVTGASDDWSSEIKERTRLLRFFDPPNSTPFHVHTQLTIDIGTEVRTQNTLLDDMVSGVACWLIASCSCVPSHPRTHAPTHRTHPSGRGLLAHGRADGQHDAAAQQDAQDVLGPPHALARGLCRLRLRLCLLHRAAQGIVARGARALSGSAAYFGESGASKRR